MIAFEQEVNDEHLETLQKEYVDGVINERELETRLESLFEHGEDLDQLPPIEYFNRLIERYHQRGEIVEAVAMSNEFHQELLSSHDIVFSNRVSDATDSKFAPRVLGVEVYLREDVDRIKVIETS